MVEGEAGAMGGTRLIGGLEGPGLRGRKKSRARMFTAARAG